MVAWTGSEEGWVSAWKQMRMEDYMATSMVDLAKPELCSPSVQLGIPSSGPRSTPEYPCKWDARLVVEPTRFNPCRPRPISQVASVAASPGVRPSPPRLRLPLSPLLLR
ncbi:hypothetical protein U0070_022017 [Myodes glareolus]|uniref:Uncharacterized protein n=1 Tax=Myodes glareolus TaxID=447135 RepID=A0AAW0HB23_MYOGA